MLYFQTLECRFIGREAVKLRAGVGDYAVRFLRIFQSIFGVSYCTIKRCGDFDCKMRPYIGKDNC
jgi:hypothetical protein